MNRGVLLRAFFALWVLGFLCSCNPDRHSGIVVGSKNFSEQSLLGEIVAQHLEARTHQPVTRRFYLAGSYICQQALLAGRIDTYVEYTGTALTAILHDPLESNPSAVFAPRAKRIQETFWSGSTAIARIQQYFRNRRSRRRCPPIEPENHLRRRAIMPASGALASATSSWSGRTAIQASLAHTASRSLNRRASGSGTALSRVAGKQVDLVAGNSTDGLLSARDLAMLEDDKHYFPPYEAVPIVRSDTLARYPEARAALLELSWQN